MSGLLTPAKIDSVYPPIDSFVSLLPSAALSKYNNYYHTLKYRSGQSGRSQKPLGAYWLPGFESLLICYFRVGDRVSDFESVDLNKRPLNSPMVSSNGVPGI